jgi:protein-tyrosine phosphatase
MDRSIYITEFPFGLNGNIFRSMMPFGKYDYAGKTLDYYKEEKIDTVVVLADVDEIPALKIGRTSLIALYSNLGYSVVHFPVADFGVPKDKQAFNNLAKQIVMLAKEGKNVAIHCQAGIGRTGTLLSQIAKIVFNMSGEKAIDWVRQTMPEAVETPEQVKFLCED